MQIFGKALNHFEIYYLGLILTVILLPLSKFALSLSMIFLIINWLLENNFKTKWELLLKNKGLIIFLGIFLVHVLWLVNTQNFKYAFTDLSNKSILLLYPIVIGTSKKLSIRRIKILLVWFSIGVTISCMISTLILIGIIQYPIQEIRDISVFMSHIRLSLLINFSIFSLGYVLLSGEFKIKKRGIFLYSLMIVYQIVFLYLLKSLTGIVIFFIVLFLVLGFVSFKIKDIIPRLFLQISLVTVFLLIVSYSTHSISRFYTKEITEIEELDKYTQSGNLYEHSVESQQIENGKDVWLYVCTAELEREWNKVSTIAFNAEDKKGQNLSHTLIRYITSKGYRKDSTGISKLTESDVNNIEQGMANYLFANKYAIYPKIYQVIWQIDVYRKGYNPEGNSITQRIEFFKTGLNIIKSNFWFGVGTGDVQDSFNKQYDIDKSQLSRKWRLRTHNQYATFFIAFGFIGFVVILGSIFYPVFMNGGFKNLLFIIFILIVLLSFINEDTLETQIGVTFFTYFYSLLLFGNKANIKTKDYG